MSDGLNHMFPKDVQVSDDELLDYLNNRLTPAQRADLEQRLAASDFFTDAEEGLQLVQHKETVPQAVAQINRNFIEKLRSKRHKPARPAPSLSLIIISTLLILALIVFAFLVILKMK